MTQYNTNPTPTSSTSGYSKQSGSFTFTATADGLRIQKGATTGYQVLLLSSKTIPGGNYALHGWQVRRNTSTSNSIQDITLENSGGSYAWTGAGPGSTGPVGGWVTLPRMNSRSGSGWGTTCDVSLSFGDGPVDITLRNLYIYNLSAAPAETSFALDAGDATFTVSGGDNSLVRTFGHNNANNEAVNKVTWSWGDGSSNSTQATISGSGILAPSFPTLNHTFPAAGIYTVTMTAEYSRVYSVPAEQTSGLTYSTSQQVVVPSGPFVADYTYSSSSLNLSVNAGISQVPTYDTISSYTWEWGDGTPNGSGASASHTYAEPGTYQVKLTTRTPATLRTSTVTKDVVVELPPTPPADLTAVIAKSIFSGRFSSWNVNTEVEELPTPISFSLAVPANDMPSLTMKYSLKGENGDKVRDLIGQEYDLGFRIFNPKTYQWFEPRGCRWVMQDDDLNLMDATGMVSLKGVGVANDLDGIIVSARESAGVGKTFKTADGAVTAGRVMGTLLEGEVIEYGHKITRVFTNTADTSGTAFSKSLNSNYEVGSSQSFLQVLQDMTEMGLCNWTTQGNELQLFDDGSPQYGKDLAFGGANDVYLLPGREVKAIQTSRSRRDYIHTLWVPKSDGTFYKRETTSPVSRRGKKAQLITGNPVATPADADLVTGAVLEASGKARREQYTYELNLSNRLAEGGALPFVDYNPGDLVWAIGDSGALEPMQVQQITLTGGAGQPLEGSVILADRLLLQSVQRAKNTARALGSGAHYTNTIVGRTTQETPFGARRASAAQTIPNATVTVLAPGVSDGLRGGMTYNGSNAFVVPVGGLYDVAARCGFVANANGVRLIYIRKNGTALLRVAGSTTGCSAALTLLCAAGDTIDVAVYQTSGGNLDTDWGAGGVGFSVVKCGD